MEKTAIINKLTDIFRDVLENEQIVLHSQTTAKDIGEWDSLNHIQLVVAIEKAYKIKFTTAEIQNWKSVGDMVDSINTKLAVN
jgi:acyl carrier protein